MKRTGGKKLPDRFRAELERVISPHNSKVYDREGNAKRDCSKRTKVIRRKVLIMAFEQLWDMGFHLQSPKNIRKRHIDALVKRWDDKGARTLHTWLSILNVFLRWIGKPDLVESPSAYYPPEKIRRTTACKTNKAWLPENGVDKAAIITKAKELDERMGLYLTLEDIYGLREKESIEMKPLRAITDDGQFFYVTDGTKGGRGRTLPIDTPEKRDVVAWAKAIAMKHHGDLRWPGKTWTQAERRFRYLAEKLGLTKKGLGVTPHGLRAGFAQERYRQETGGLPSPIEGGAIGKIDRETHQKACRRVSQDMGHWRQDVTAAYYGTYGHALRTTKDPEMGHCTAYSGTYGQALRPTKILVNGVEVASP